jgi:hypothetical protein
MKSSGSGGEWKGFRMMFDEHQHWMGAAVLEERRSCSLFPLNRPQLSCCRWKTGRE